MRVEFVKAGSRLGWRWTNCKRGGACETQWLDPEPNSTDEGYEKYLQELKHTKNVVIFRGFKRPPNRQEHVQRIADVIHPMFLRHSNKFSSDEESDFEQEPDFYYEVSDEDDDSSSDDSSNDASLRDDSLLSEDSLLSDDSLSDDTSLSDDSLSD